eukprot:13707664-Ditylum_brightwellii.AAC.1
MEEGSKQESCEFQEIEISGIAKDNTCPSKIQEYEVTLCNHQSEEELPSAMPQKEEEASSGKTYVDEGDLYNLPVVLTLWKNAREMDAIKTISPIRRFRSARETFAQPADKISPVMNTSPRKMFQITRDK